MRWHPGLATWPACSGLLCLTSVNLIRLSSRMTIQPESRALRARGRDRRAPRGRAVGCWGRLRTPPTRSPAPTRRCQDGRRGVHRSVAQPIVDRERPGVGPDLQDGASTLPGARPPLRPPSRRATNLAPPVHARTAAWSNSGRLHTILTTMPSRPPTVGKRSMTAGSCPGTITPSDPANSARRSNAPYISASECTELNGRSCSKFS